MITRTFLCFINSTESFNCRWRASRVSRQNVRCRALRLPWLHLESESRPSAWNKWWTTLRSVSKNVERRSRTASIFVCSEHGKSRRSTRRDRSPSTRNVNNYYWRKWENKISTKKIVKIAKDRIIVIENGRQRRICEPNDWGSEAAIPEARSMADHRADKHINYWIHERNAALCHSIQYVHILTSHSFNLPCARIDDRFACVGVRLASLFVIIFLFSISLSSNLT